MADTQKRRSVGNLIVNIFAVSPLFLMSGMAAAACLLKPERAGLFAPTIFIVYGIGGISLWRRLRRAFP